ncbi:putative protein kinase CAMK-CDPK family [Helianthus annuus]|nr:putative protein kinase CAMK-CDPK family [Helianthus annuus]
MFQVKSSRMWLKPVLCCSGGSFEALWSRSGCVDRRSDTLRITQWCAPVLGWYGIFDAVLKGYIVFESDPWPFISDSAKDLIRKMLCSRPSDRLTAHEILCHPWICENGVAPDRALDLAVLSRLKQFSVMNKLKKMALRVIDESLSEEEIVGLREMFREKDKVDKDTMLDRISQIEAMLTSTIRR